MSTQHAPTSELPPGWNAYKGPHCISWTVVSAGGYPVDVPHIETQEEAIAMAWNCSGMTREGNLSS